MLAQPLVLVDIEIAVGSHVLLRDVNLTIGAGETHILFGPNGSGKSSLLSAIMGLPPYQVTHGEIRLGDERIDHLPVDARARLGLGMAFQRPPALDGVTVKALAQALEADARLADAAAALDLADFVGRDINVGFSGGEIKRWEILKLFLQHPGICLFDEPESGVDLEHIAAVGAAMGQLLGHDASLAERRSALIITHTGFILDHVRADMGHMLVNGELVCSGDPRRLFEHIKAHGYTLPPWASRLGSVTLDERIAQ
ncbi:iron-regulated ABC transporter ATPase subunit SufC [Hephaestia caeni]|uniref:Iron-regulated ABC transporter ATPase subunit SufC n=2 Tax=Hephaestia caeni TaxID=645617 RepID=A0A397P9Z6_9SPHN|nr:iron-regulated ABC transporter ATPase subunit SufC [Hephaestia caeni]